MVCRIHHYQNSKFNNIFKGWKAQNIGDNGWESPFTVLLVVFCSFFSKEKYQAILEPSRCGASLDGWNYREEKRVSVEAIRCGSLRFLPPGVPLLRCLLPNAPLPSFLHSFVQSSAFSHFPISRCLSMSFSLHILLLCAAFLVLIPTPLIADC